MMKYSTKITNIKVILKNNVVASNLDFLWYTVSIPIMIIKVSNDIRLQKASQCRQFIRRS